MSFDKLEYKKNASPSQQQALDTLRGDGSKKTRVYFYLGSGASDAKITTPAAASNPLAAETLGGDTKLATKLVSQNPDVLAEAVRGLITNKYSPFGQACRRCLWCLPQVDQ